MRRSLERLRKIYFAFAKGIDTPRSLKAWLLFREGEWAQLIEFSVHPSEYRDSDSFAVDYAITSFIRKNVDLPAKIDKRALAIQSFEHSELQCKSTNLRLRARASGSFSEPDVERILFAAQRKIAKVLGVYDESKWIDLCAWGPGATSDLNRREAYLDIKHVQLPLSSTSSAAGLFLRAMSGDLHWLQAVERLKPTSIFTIVDGGEHDTVRKTAGIDRNIEKNPRANLFLQKGLGEYMRRRLKRFGVDLTDQSINQTLASIARDLNLCTLDLQNASDTIATEVVFELLPIDWALALDAVRTRRMRVSGQWRDCHRFSSMGNGFTFELESLIYWSIVASVEEESGRTLFGVYGDDLICHRDNAPLVSKVLQYLGFTLNKAKSFVSGEFFESCGKHYYGSREVTPAYQKDQLRTDLDLIRCGNRLLRLAARLGNHVILDKRIRGAWEECKREAGDRVPVGPIGEGDRYFCVPRESYRHLRYQSGRGYRTSELKVEIPLVPSYDEAMYALWLRRRHGGQSVGKKFTHRDIAATSLSPFSRRYVVSESRLMTSVRSLSRPTTVDEELGTLSSRAEERGRLRLCHIWVTPEVGSNLDW